MSVEQKQTDYDRSHHLQRLLIARATGEPYSDSEFVDLRLYFIKSMYSHHIPIWLRAVHSLDQFWSFIKPKFSKYADRREFIYKEFSPLLEATEVGCITPIENSLELLLEKPTLESVNESWQRCLARSTSDPEGAVTAAKTLLETVLKHVAEDLDLKIEKKNPGLPELYTKVAQQLNLSPQNHNEKLIKKILSGCNSVVTGIGELRNLYGDAHGKDRRKVKLERRHAHLAINLAGSMASFLIETTINKLEKY